MVPERSKGTDLSSVVFITRGFEPHPWYDTACVDTIFFVCHTPALASIFLCVFYEHVREEYVLAIHSDGQALQDTHVG
jgi:hypothetical protein